MTQQSPVPQAESRIGEQFMALTRYQHLSPSAQSQGEPQPALELPYNVTGRVTDLPNPADLALDPVDLHALITDRTTVRRYAKTPITQLELSYLLWCTQGVKSVVGTARTYRTVPSAGARHAFETVLLINRVEDLSPGLYRYVASTQQLVTISLGDEHAEMITTHCMNQAQVRQSAVTFIWVAVVERMAWRYGQRGYRYLHLDAGHVCQNLYLAAEPIECGVCAIAAFDDDALNQALGLDGADQFAIYVATLGKKQ